MPELPEVETIARVLNPLVAKKQIADVRVFRAKNLLTGEEGFLHLKGESFLGVSRRGKFLLFHLTHGLVVVSHLRMEGKYYAAKASDAAWKHDILIYDFTDGTALRYNDVRKFGVLWLEKENECLAASPLCHLGKEPWDLSAPELYAGLQKRHGPIKTALLDQRLISGLGNIYDDEVLFAARINPKTPANALTLAEAKTVLAEARRILSLAIEKGGSTIRSYHAAEGLSGAMQTNLLAYGRGDKPCVRCGFPLRKIALGGRGTVYCPRCQPLQGHPLVVGITGPIASGKSAVAADLKKKGYAVIDADEIVSELYEKKSVLTALRKRFGKDVVTPDGVNRDALRKLVTDSLAAKKALEAMIHPLVYREMLSRLRSSKADKIALDVPLLLKSPLAKECDLIIAVMASEDVERKRLIARGKDPRESLALNASWPRQAAKKAAGLVLDGGGSLSSLQKQLDEAKYL